MTFYSDDSDYVKNIEVRKAKKFPIIGPWLNGNIIEFRQNMAAKKEPSGGDHPD